MQGPRIYYVDPQYIVNPENSEWLTLYKRKTDDKLVLRKSDGSEEIIFPVSTDKNFVFNQAIPSNEWVVVHNLGKKCSVTIVDDLNNQMYAKVVYDNNNQVTIYFNKNKTGSVFCN